MASKLCSRCILANLSRTDFTDPPFVPEGKYKKTLLQGTVSDLKVNKKHCKLCDLLWYALQQNQGSLKDVELATKWQARWLQNSFEYDPAEAGVEEQYGSGLYPQLDIEGSSYNYCIQLVDEKDTKEFLRGRVVSNDFDTSLVQSWLSLCRREHGERCKESYMESKTHPGNLAGFMVINVDDLCLQDLPSGEEYVALSYVWGPANRPLSLKSNVSEFREPSGLRIQLPQTIQDAIAVTKRLAFPFLWIDSLCIVQDDMDTKAALIANMDAIYSHAALTLVAASGKEAQAGLSGVSSGRRRMYTQDFAPGFCLGVLPFFEEEMMRSEHATRAWTYQETCLSPRCLIFLNGFVYFACREAVWGEHVMAELPNIRPMEGANTLGKNQDEQPLRRFQQHMTAYTSRNLSYQADGLNAFSGIANALSRYLGHTKIPFGLPASVFDWAMLWTVNWSERDLKRRDGFPSWSWVGWQGLTDMAQDTDCEYDQQWLLKGTWIDWFTVDERGEIVLVWDPKRDGTTVSPLVAAVGQDARAGEEHDVDGNVQEEACPSYGWPSPSSPYGRFLDERLLSMLPLKQAPCPLPIPSGIPAASLYFFTMVVSLHIAAQHPQAETGLVHVLDAYHNVCGFVKVNDQSFIQNIGQLETRSVAREMTSEVVLLSATPYGVLSMNHNKIAAFASQYQQNEMNTTELNESDLPGDFEFLNIMLTRPQEAHATIEMNGRNETIQPTERLGLGILHKDAVRNALHPGITWKDIVLV